MHFSEDNIRTHLGRHSTVFVQIAARGDGSPEIAWGDTFFYLRNANGDHGKMPFTTIVTKDYDGFDCESKLNRGGLFRLNIEVGTEKFTELFGFPPKEFEAKRTQFDFPSIDTLFPHPVYGAYGWISIINPGHASTGLIKSLLDFAHERSRSRTSVEPTQS
ncbi:MAG: DUF6194 family protein [Planctomycetaceae bacterium]